MSYNLTPTICDSILLLETKSGLCCVNLLDDKEFECSSLRHITSKFQPHGKSGKKFIFIFVDSVYYIYYTVEYDSSGIIDFGVPIPPSMKIYRISCSSNTHEWIYNEEHEHDTSKTYLWKNKNMFWNECKNIMFFVAHE